MLIIAGLGNSSLNDNTRYFRQIVAMPIFIVIIEAWKGGGREHVGQTCD